MYEFGQTGTHGFWSRTGPSSENPHVSRQFLETQRKLVPERTFQVEYEAAFVSAEGAVFPRESVERCLVTELGEVRGPFVVGLDWGRYQDFTAIAVLSGHRDEAKLVHLERFQLLGWERQIDRVEGVLSRFPGCRVLTDSTGAGDVILDRVWARMPSQAVEPFRFDSGSKRRLIDGLASLIDRAALKMRPDPNLLDELDSFRSFPTAHEGLRLEARSGRHDDLVIALALAAKLLPTQHSPGIRLGSPR